MKGKGRFAANSAFFNQAKQGATENFVVGTGDDFSGGVEIKMPAGGPPAGGDQAAGGGGSSHNQGQTQKGGGVISAKGLTMAFKRAK